MAVELEINSQFQRALTHLREKSEHLFLTGKAGTGKSTLLRLFREEVGPSLVVVAPTGVAAVNVDGETIHSFFGFRPGVTKEEAKEAAKSSRKRVLMRELHTLVIDEISMVRADLLDCIDVYLRAVRASGRAFGGVRLIFIGDLYQLPPVLSSDEAAEYSKRYRSPYFFDAEVMQSFLGEDMGGFAYIELTEVYRQSDQHFLSLLNNIRNNTVTSDDLSLLASRYQPQADPGSHALLLTGRKDRAAQLNQQHLDALPGLPRYFAAKNAGDVQLASMPAEAQLALKEGARVMLTNNDNSGRWINGTLATVEAISEEVVTIVLDTGKRYKVESYTWELSRTVFDEESGELARQTVGSYTQMPLTLAKAMTIHKAQGKTFDEVAIDLGGRAFAHGQAYVALSRCRTLEGITLLSPIERRDIIMDSRVKTFLQILSQRDASLQGDEWPS